MPSTSTNSAQNLNCAQPPVLPFCSKGSAYRIRVLPLFPTPLDEPLQENVSFKLDGSEVGGCSGETVW